LASAHAQPQAERAPSITVSADTSVSGEPDQAQIDIGVSTQARTAPEASKENAERLARVLAELRKLLGKGDELKTSGYALHPQYRHPPGGKPEIAGYTATNSVRVKTGRLDEVGRLIDAAMQAGANQVNRLQFSLKDEEAMRLQALRQAALKARNKADALAAALGLKVLRVIALNEGAQPIQPIVRAAAMARSDAMSAAPTPIEPGTVEVRAAVTLMVEIGER
jgi:hypothetical protein